MLSIALSHRCILLIFCAPRKLAAYETTNTIKRYNEPFETPVTSMDVDIGIKMRQDYKGDPRSKVLDRPSRLVVVDVASRRGACSIFLRLFPSVVFKTHTPLHRKFGSNWARGSRHIYLDRRR